MLAQTKGPLSLTISITRLKALFNQPTVIIRTPHCHICPLEFQHNILY
ncbi:hypothetical protein MNBD_GAMMA12-3652 [hydrothermal vent metagenome]|uniref:Uncharacterized protein n=1 Tax=hydrothermal vent metagenome TaxID=652676 RepID=A0A3B0YSS1_9ZZZZ